MADDKEKDSVRDEVDGRLDDFFSEDDWEEPAATAETLDADPEEDIPVVEAAPVAASPAGGGDLAEELGIKDMKVLVLSLEWEITDSLMDKLVAEVERLKVTWKDDAVLVTYLDILGLLGKYIRVKKASSHPSSMVLLREVYESLEDTLTKKDMDETERKRAVLAMVQKFNRLKKSIGTGKPLQKEEPVMEAQVVEAEPVETVMEAQVVEAEPVAAAAPVAPAPAAPDTSALTQEIANLKKMIQSEVKSIKTEIQSVHDALIQAITDLSMSLAGLRQILSAGPSMGAAAAPAAEPVGPEDDGLDDLGDLEPDEGTPLPGQAELAAEDDLVGELGLPLEEEGGSDDEVEIDLPDLDFDK